MNTLPDTWPFPSEAEDQREAVAKLVYAVEVKPIRKGIAGDRQRPAFKAKTGRANVTRHERTLQVQILPPLTLIPDAPY